MGHIDYEAANSHYLQTMYLNVEATNQTLRADLRKANKEIEMLKEYITELRRDLDAAIKECNDHHHV